ncbi:MAG: NYN domain-containing protein [Planctomycetes bacterium]|nr:NYN domain-containing protein [Planctomycetota bacterium]
MNTCVYIDALNLYYKRLRRSRFRWLDLVKFADLLLTQDTVAQVNLYYAAVKSPPWDRGSHDRQNTYFSALRTLERLELIEGKMRTTFEDKVAKEPLPDGRYVLRRVYVTEEKGSDVNLATDLLWDAVQNRYEKAVVVSGDTDLVRAMHIVKERTATEIVSVIPRASPTPPGDNESGYIRQLRNVSHHQITYISDGLLAEAQLPDRVVTRRGKVKHKPPSWEGPWTEHPGVVHERDIAGTTYYAPTEDGGTSTTAP